MGFDLNFGRWRRARFEIWLAGASLNCHAGSASPRRRVHRCQARQETPGTSLGTRGIQRGRHQTGLGGDFFFFSKSCQAALAPALVSET